MSRARLRYRLAGEVQQRIRCAAKDLNDAPTEDEMKRLERLHKLVLLDVPTLRGDVIGYALLGAFLVAVVIGSVYALVRADQTEIQLQAGTSAFAFTAADTPAIALRGSFRAVTIFNALEIDSRIVGGSIVDSLRKYSSTARPRTVSIQSLNADASVEFAGLTLEEGARMELRTTPSGSHRLRMAGRDTSFQVSASGRVRYVVTPGFDTVVSLRRPTTVRVSVPAEENSLELSIAPSEPVTFVSQGRVRALDFRRTQSSADGATRVSSGIDSGSIVYTALNGQRRTIWPGDEVAFESDSAGVLQELVLRPGASTLHFRGDVTHLRLGWNHPSRSLMPTNIEHLVALSPLQTVYGALVAGAALLVGLARWWRSRIWHGSW